MHNHVKTKEVRKRKKKQTMSVNHFTSFAKNTTTNVSLCRLLHCEWWYDIPSTRLIILFLIYMRVYVFVRVCVREIETIKNVHVHSNSSNYCIWSKNVMKWFHRNARKPLRLRTSPAAMSWLPHVFGGETGTIVDAMLPNKTACKWILLLLIHRLVRVWP